MLKEKDLNKIQNKLGYRFKNTRLLEQAFTRKSFSVWHGGEHNEVLEFFGDRILDFAVIKDFYDLHGKFNIQNEFVSAKTVGELCKTNIELVKNTHLAEQISRLGFTKYLQVEKQAEKCSMKPKADLFEAILGAVALDSDWDLQKISAVFHAMMYSRAELTERMTPTFNPEDYIDFFETEVWKLNIFKTGNKYEKTADGVEGSFVMLLNGSECKVTASGETEHSAKVKLCEKGYKILCLFMKGEFIEEMSYSEQLYLLHSCGLVGEPRFRFEVFPCNSQNPEEVWRCYGGLANSDTEFEADDSTRSEAQEQVSYAILCDMLGIAADEVVISEEMPGAEECRIPDGPGDFTDLRTELTAAEEVSAKSACGIHRGGLLNYILAHYGSAA